MTDTTTKQPVYNTFTPQARIVIQGHRVTELTTRDGVVIYADCESGWQFERVNGRWEEYVQEPPGCECEIDWRCGLHQGQPTWLETRYDFLSEPEWAI